MNLAAKRFKARETEMASPKRAKRLEGLLLLLGLFLLARLAFAGERPSQGDFAEIYARANVSFREADFFKPEERDAESLTFRLAPLLIQQVEPLLNTNRPHAGFGTLLVTNGLTALERSRPAVYVQPGTLLFHGKPHLTFTYLWFYNFEPPSRGAGGVPVQGVRLTLNSAAELVLWEVLAEPSGAELIFVSQRLEAAALAQFGKPLPGRRYAVERGTNEAPATVVARVVDDGPVPMGPIVYLSAGTHTVSTLICRCMPVQAKTLRATRTYALLPFPMDAPELQALVRKLKARGLATFWPGDKATEDRLQTRLRLPEEF